MADRTEREQQIRGYYKTHHDPVVDEIWALLDVARAEADTLRADLAKLDKAYTRELAALAAALRAVEIARKALAAGEGE